MTPAKIIGPTGQIIKVLGKGEKLVTAHVGRDLVEHYPTMIVITGTQSGFQTNEINDLKDANRSSHPVDFIPGTSLHLEGGLIAEPIYEVEGLETTNDQCPSRVYLHR